MRVISFIGPSGSGKTTISNYLEHKYPVLSSNYIDLDRHSLDNRTLLSKWRYLGDWYDKIIETLNSGVDLCFTDRNPIDTCAYINHGQEDLLNCINISSLDLERLDIFQTKILVTADFKTLENRIIERIKLEPERKEYHELNPLHNLHAYNFYDSNRSSFDYIFDTSNINKIEMEGEFKKLLLKIIPIEEIT